MEKYSNVLFYIGDIAIIFLIIYIVWIYKKNNAKKYLKLINLSLNDYEIDLKKDFVNRQLNSIENDKFINADIRKSFTQVKLNILSLIEEKLFLDSEFFDARPYNLIFFKVIKKNFYKSTSKDKLIFLNTVIAYSSEAVNKVQNESVQNRNIIYGTEYILERAKKLNETFGYWNSNTITINALEQNYKKTKYNNV